MSESEIPPRAGASVDVCVVGSFNADLVVRTSRWPDRGETVIGSDVETFLGGKGFNQAVAASRAGARTAIVGALGADEHAARFRRALRHDDIDDAAVQEIADAGTGLAFVVVDDGGENSIIVVPRANHALTVADLDRHADLIAGAGVVLLQLELPIDVVVAAATMARRGGATVVLNPAPAVGAVDRFAGLVDIVVPNESELAALLAAPSSNTAAAAHHLAALTGKAGVVVTLGDQGAFVWTAAGSSTLPPHDVVAVDTVGAGDAFCGHLAARSAAGAGLDDAARHANAAGALATTRAGAEPSMPSHGDVVALLAAAAAGPPASGERLDPSPSMGETRR